MLKPVDIQNKEFEKKLKGYDCDEVDDFLDAIIQDYEALFQENQSLKNRIGVQTPLSATNRSRIRCTNLSMLRDSLRRTSRTTQTWRRRRS